MALMLLKWVVFSMFTLEKTMLLLLSITLVWATGTVEAERRNVVSLEILV